jgi:hypothetical protein
MSRVSSTAVVEIFHGQYERTCQARAEKQPVQRLEGAEPDRLGAQRAERVRHVGQTEEGPKKRDVGLGVETERVSVECPLGRNDRGPPLTEHCATWRKRLVPWAT